MEVKITTEGTSALLNLSVSSGTGLKQLQLCHLSGARAETKIASSFNYSKCKCIAN